MSTLDNLEKLDQSQRSNPKNSSFKQFYAVHDGQITWLKSQGESRPLCNFTAKIISEEVRDDGIEPIQVYKISGTLQSGNHLRELTVLSRIFPAMTWVADWGSRAVVYAGNTSKDHLRTAIQILSTGAPIQTVYTHLGWRIIDGKWIFLHAGGGIGADGPVEGVLFNPNEGNLNTYCLPIPPELNELREVFKSSLKLLNVAPPAIIYPLLASVYRSILVEIFPVDFSMFLEGPTGVFKSELSALIQAHFGGFHRLNLPAAWTSTDNYLERQCSLAKDVILTIDDFAPQATHGAIAVLHQKAERIFRGQGNHGGRGRMRADGSLRPVCPPRGLILSSGEDVPRGHSLRARLVVIAIGRDDIDKACLTELQTHAKAGDFAAVTSAFISYVAGNFEEIRAWAPKRHIELREKMSMPGHRRNPDSLANLMLGFEAFVKFGRYIGVLEIDQSNELLEKGLEALLEIGKRQGGYQLGEDPTERFIDHLRSTLSSGAAYIADAQTGSVPGLNATAWGWREASEVIRHNDGMKVSQWEPRGLKIGWLDKNELLLNADSTLQILQRQARDQNESLPLTKQTLIKRLVERGIVIPSPSEDKNVTKRTVEGRRETVLVVPVHRILLETMDFRDSGDMDWTHFNASNVSSVPHL